MCCCKWSAGEAFFIVLQGAVEVRHLPITEDRVPRVSVRRGSLAAIVDDEEVCVQLWWTIWATIALTQDGAIASSLLVSGHQAIWLAHWFHSCWRVVWRNVGHWPSPRCHCRLLGLGPRLRSGPGVHVKGPRPRYEDEEEGHTPSCASSSDATRTPPPLHSCQVCPQADVQKGSSCGAAPCQSAEQAVHFPRLAEGRGLLPGTLVTGAQVFKGVNRSAGIPPPPSGSSRSLTCGFGCGFEQGTRIYRRGSPVVGVYFLRIGSVVLTQRHRLRPTGMVLEYVLRRPVPCYTVSHTRRPPTAAPQIRSSTHVLWRNVCCQGH